MTARRSATSVSRRVRACRCSSASKISTRSRPRSLARYIAASAFASSWAAVRSIVAAGGREADRERHRHRALADVAPGLRARPGCARPLAARRGVGEVVAQDDELVATEPADRIGAPHAAGQAPGDLAQHLVAPVVPERVVDQLEVVDVHEHHRHGAATPAAPP